MVLIWKSKQPETEEADAAMLFHALAHPVRLRIVRLLMEQDARPCGDLVDKLPVAQSTVSQHLKVLKNAGIVSDHPDGPRRHYQLRDEARDKLKKYLSQLGL
jgi:ArsR family transcriptional regulator, arsenate/arsenite/antimonite-responsive transcriptional repressor